MLYVIAGWGISRRGRPVLYTECAGTQRIHSCVQNWDENTARSTGLNSSHPELPGSGIAPPIQIVIPKIVQKRDASLPGVVVGILRTYRVGRIAVVVAL